MRILGLDIGTKRIGVAISDPLGITAQGLAVIDCENAAAALERLAGICREQGVARIVAGLPLHLSGKRGDAVREVERFAAAIEEHTGLPVEFIDERLTSRAAERTLIAGKVRREARKKVRDMLAAVLILETYLNSAAGPARRQPAAENTKRSVYPLMEESSISKDDLVTLTDEEGNEHDFAVIDAFPVGEKRYAILLPAYEDEEGEDVVDVEEDAYIFRVEMDEETGEETLAEVDDEEEWEHVAMAWEERLDALEEEDGEEDEDDEDPF